MTTVARLGDKKGKEKGNLTLISFYPLKTLKALKYLPLVYPNFMTSKIIKIYTMLSS